MAIEDDAVAGMDRAHRMLLAVADGDEAGALLELNTATGAEVRWATASLLSLFREQMIVLARFNPEGRSWQDLLRSAAEEARGEDVVMTGLEVAVDEFLRRGDLDA